MQAGYSPELVPENPLTDPWAFTPEPPDEMGELSSPLSLLSLLDESSCLEGAGADEEVGAACAEELLLLDDAHFSSSFHDDDEDGVGSAACSFASLVAGAGDGAGAALLPPDDCERRAGQDPLFFSLAVPERACISLLAWCLRWRAAAALWTL